MTEEQLEAEAKARWRRARTAFERQNPLDSGWVHLLAMSMCLAAKEQEFLKSDIVEVARAGGLIP